MAMSKAMVDIINIQIKNEFESAYLYLAMANYFALTALDGFAHWLNLQVKEETSHGMKFIDFLIDRNEKPDLKSLELLKAQWKSPLEAFQDAYKHELFVTDRISAMLKVADDEEDHMAFELLQWYIHEQVEEERQTLDIVQQLEIIEKEGSGLLILDEKLSERK